MGALATRAIAFKAPWLRRLRLLCGALCGFGMLTFGCAPFSHAREPVGASSGRVSSRYVGEPLEVVGGAKKGPGLVNGNSAYITYTVKSGDTLWRISQRHGVGVDVLLRENGIRRPESLRAGVALRIPVKRRTGDSDAPSAAPEGADIQARKGAPERKRQSQRQSTGHHKRPSGTNEAIRAGDRERRELMQWPIQGTIASRFAQRGSRPHDGIDIAAPRGTRVRAADAGLVLFADRHRSYGNLIVVQHAEGLVTVYAHNDINLVRKGQRVDRGQVIARVGDTGRATGAHLHFEVRRGTRPENPLRFLPP